MPAKIQIAAAAEIANGQTRKFVFQRDGMSINGFLARFEGRLVAYENVCRHIPLSLDSDDNRFFTSDGRHFVCQNHGALYEPLTGLCVRGPCEGQKLKPLAIEERNGAIWLVSSDDSPS